MCAISSTAAPLQLAGVPVELTLSEVSKNTLRLQLLPLDEHGKPREASPSTILVPFSSGEKLRLRELPQPTQLRLGSLRVSIEPNPLSISVTKKEGRRVQDLVFDEGTNCSLSFRTDAPVFGLGEGEHQFDRRDHNYPMKNGQMAPWLATHGATIPVPFLIGADGWALFIHRPWGTFDLREGKGRFLPGRESIGKELIELFVISCDEPADALAEFVRLTGHPVMPPKWVLGYIQSHRTLSGPVDPLHIAQTFRNERLPCDALIYLGTGYCTNGWNTGHGSLEFNPNAFNHPAEQIQALHNLNFKVILHINHAPRNLFGTSISPPDRTAIPPLPFRRGEGRGEGGSFSAEDFSSPLHISNYWTRHREDFALGVDGWWPDDGDELPIEARLARHRCYFEGPLLDRPNVRPWSLHRNGFAGVARYGGWIWSGDVESRWSTLAAHVPVGLNYSLSVTPFWGTDTGGFIPTREFTGELYVRWFQFSAFNPLFRSHGRTWHLRLPWGWNTGDLGPIESRDVTDRAELHNVNVEPICRKYLELRYQLLPYNYALIREACDKGLPPMRALWLHYPKDPEAVKLGDEYLWGKDLLVAPVVEKGATSRHLYLPAGAWHDWWTGQKLTGGRWIDRSVDLGTMPLYARAGAIIPFDPVRQYVSQPVGSPTSLKIFPGANGDFTLYDDDGQTMAYSNDSDSKAIWIHFKWNDSEHTLTIEPDKRMKKWPGASRKFSIHLQGFQREPALVEFSGKRTTVKL